VPKLSKNLLLAENYVFPDTPLQSNARPVGPDGIAAICDLVDIYNALYAFPHNNNNTNNNDINDIIKKEKKNKESKAQCFYLLFFFFFFFFFCSFVRSFVRSFLLLRIKVLAALGHRAADGGAEHR
jgi:hypothetical protein